MTFPIMNFSNFTVYNCTKHICCALTIAKKCIPWSATASSTCLMSWEQHQMDVACKEVKMHDVGHLLHKCGLGMLFKVRTMFFILENVLPSAIVEKRLASNQCLFFENIDCTPLLLSDARIFVKGFIFENLFSLILCQTISRILPWLWMVLEIPYFQEEALQIKTSKFNFISIIQKVHYYQNDWYLLHSFCCSSGGVTGSKKYVSWYFVIFFRKPRQKKEYPPRVSSL